MQPAGILIVDDDPNIRTNLRHCLETAGYAVEQAQHGADALEMMDLAAKYYQRAVLTDPKYRPAGENLRQVCEVRDCGQTRRPVFRDTPSIPGERGLGVDRALSTRPLEK